MKILLSLWSAFSLLGAYSPLISPLSLNPQTHKSNGSFFAEKIVSWYGDNDFDYIIENTFSPSTNLAKTFYWEVKIGKLEKDFEGKAKWWLPVDANKNSTTWTSWGSTRRTGQPFASKGTGIFSNIDLRKSGTVDETAIYKNANVQLQYWEEYWGLARLESHQAIGLSLFQRNNDYFVSIFGFQIAKTSWSWSGGMLFANLGTGIKIVSY